MIRPEFTRIGPLWLAVNVDDYGNLRYPRLGLTQNHAAGRTARAAARAVGVQS